MGQFDSCSDSRRWGCSAESEMLTHGAGLERMHPQPGYPEIGVLPAALHQQTRVFENL